MWEELKSVKDISIIDYADIVYRNVSIKEKVVTQDPKEKGLRKILNFGHTIGHAIESILLDSDDHLLHGEAIAIGMICEGYLSYLKGYLKIEEAEEIKQTFISIYGQKKKSLPSQEMIWSMMKHDKKNIDGRIMFSLLNKIGEANINQAISYEEVNESLIFYAQ
jgi:3-dehydroquinate synthase